MIQTPNEIKKDCEKEDVLNRCDCGHGKRVLDFTCPCCWLKSNGIKIPYGMFCSFNLPQQVFKKA